MLIAASLPQVRKYMKRGEHATRDSLRSYLRAATGDDHAGLDAHLSALDWGSVHDYRHFLEASAAALLQIEAGNDVCRLAPAEVV